MIKKLRWFIVGFALLLSAYMLCDVGVVRPMVRTTATETKLVANVRKPVRRVVHMQPVTPRSKTTTALLLCLSDCLKYALLALVVTGKAGEIYDYLLQMLKLSSEGRRRVCRDKRWLQRAEKHYRFWLDMLQEPSAKVDASIAQALRDKASLWVTEAIGNGEQWVFEDVDIRDVYYVHSSAKRRVLCVDAFMRKYALDADGFIAVGSKDFRAVQEQLTWQKRGKSWFLVDVKTL